jgi:hypothetical protein
MATTTPERVRRALQRVTGAAVGEVRAVSSSAPQEPAAWRAALFATAPLIVSEYASGAATLATDWFEEIRDAANPRHLFTPIPLVAVTDDDMAAMVARVTVDMSTLERDLLSEFDRIVADTLAQLEAEMQKQVAAGFWDTMTENADEDPDAVGWQRFARPGACKFCVMLAARGAVYTRSSVKFAAHTTCHCVVGPSYDPSAPRANVMQYLASRRTRSAEDKARLREYLNHNFPDAPG